MEFDQEAAALVELAGVAEDARETYHAARDHHAPSSPMDALIFVHAAELVSDAAESLRRRFFPGSLLVFVEEGAVYVVHRSATRANRCRRVFTPPEPEAA